MPMRKPRTPLIALLAVALVAAIAVGTRFVVWSGPDKVAVSAIGGPFTLVDGDGRTVTDQTFRGRAMLLFFGYTFCPDVCPTTLGVVAAAMEKLPVDSRVQVVPVFVSVDPARDTPQVMRDYVSAFHPLIVGLTGSEDQVAAAMRAYRVYAAKVKGSDPDSYTVDHSAIIYLVGPDGRFVAHFPHGTTADELVAGLIKHLP